MPLGQYAKQEPAPHLDAADGSGPDIKGGGAIIRGIQLRVGGASGNVAEKVENNSRNEFKRLGIDLRESEPKFGKLVEGWRAENVDRAKSLAEFERDKLSDILAKGENKTVAELRQRIQDRLEVSRSKADLLARDQVLKLNAKITRERHQAAGITEYIWTTSNDERVRETHEELEGETFSWDDPPVTNEAGDRNHPGEDYQCRCVPYPVLPELGSEETADDPPDDVGEDPPAPEEPKPPEDDFAPPPEPPLIERRTDFIKALSDPKDKGGVIRDVLREQVKATLPEAVSQDIKLARERSAQVVVDGNMLRRLGAEAAHDFGGRVVVRQDVLTRAKSALRKLGDGVIVPAVERDAVRVLVHEEMHGHSRVSVRSYRGIGAKLEEVGTELNARRITGEVFGVPHTVGAYEAYINQVRTVVRDVMKAAGSPLLEEEAEKLIADAHVKGMCTGGPLLETPEQALKAFVNALDTTPDQRAAILEGLQKL